MARPLLERLGSDIFGRSRWGPAYYVTHADNGLRKVGWRVELCHLAWGCWSLRTWDATGSWIASDHPDLVEDFSNERAGKEALRHAIIVKLLTAG